MSKKPIMNNMMKMLVFVFFGIVILTAEAKAGGGIYIPVPYTSEVPTGKWIGPWKNACEEASLTMINAYYLGMRTLTAKQAERAMLDLFKWENKTFGYNSDTTAAETAKMINEYSSTEATLVRNPTIDQILIELVADHPVISFHYGYDLHNPLIPFRRGGSYYHVIVLKGYDENTGEFIVNDTGNDKTGKDFRYSSSTIMNSLHDYIRQTKKASGPPTVLFTKLKELVRAPDDPRVYLIRDNKKFYITSMSVFNGHNWAKGIIKIMPQKTLDSYPLGGNIDK